MKTKYYIKSEQCIDDCTRIYKFENNNWYWKAKTKYYKKPSKWSAWYPYMYNNLLARVNAKPVSEGDIFLAML